MMTALVTSSELAALLNVTPTRVGQYVREGKLAGCFIGDGRSRRFDLDRAAAALGRQLHPGQMLGNGASTRKAIADLKPAAQLPKPEVYRPAKFIAAPTLGDNGPEDQGPEKESETERYELARVHKAEEEVRKLRRQNQEAEGKYVLASEVERQVSRLLAQEVAEFEAMLRDGSRLVSDKLGLDYRTVRQIMTDQWRSYRATRSSVLADQATDAELSEDEVAADK